MTGIEQWQPVHLAYLSAVDAGLGWQFGNAVFARRFDFDGRGRLDVMEKDESYIITADIPGLTKKDINVNISEDVLSISGDRSHDTDQDSDRYHYRERSHGTFVRSFNLPESVNEKKITANFNDGILTIELPKAEIAEPKARQIKIN